MGVADAEPLGGADTGRGADVDMSGSVADAGAGAAEPAGERCIPGGIEVAGPGPLDVASATVGSTAVGRFCSGAAIRSALSAAWSASRSAGSVAAPTTDFARTWRAPREVALGEGTAARTPVAGAAPAAVAPVCCSGAAARRGVSLSGRRSLVTA